MKSTLVSDSGYIELRIVTSRERSDSGTEMSVDSSGTYTSSLKDYSRKQVAFSGGVVVFTRADSPWSLTKTCFSEPSRRSMSRSRLIDFISSEAYIWIV